MLIQEVPVAKIKKEGLRKILEQESLAGLANSLREVGQLQPIIVRQDEDGSYELIAGERRLAAIQMLGWERVVALLWDGTMSVKQVQLIENTQRQDLSPIERATAIKEVLRDGITKKELAARLGVPRTTLTEWLNILEVDEVYQNLVLDNFKGGDSPLTLSHLSIAVGVAHKLNRPELVNLMLDGAVEFALNKAEMRQVARRLVANPNITFEQAVKAVRRRTSEKSREGGDGLEPREELARFASTVSRLQQQLQHLTFNVVERLTQEERQDLAQGLQGLIRVLARMVTEIEAAGRKAG